jgi:hypothetical protein
MATKKLTVDVTFRVGLAWWLKPYFYVLATLCAITGIEPNYERVNYWIDRAIKIRVIEVDG